MSQVPDLQARKAPEQGRAVATVEALIEGCARVLRERGYAGATTNHIASASGVAIGSLYEYFPNRDALVFALALRRLTALRNAIESAIGSPDRSRGSDVLLRRIFEAVSADRALFLTVLRDAPHMLGAPEMRRLMRETAQLVYEAAERAGDRIELRDAPADLWLITRMLSHAVLEMASESRRSMRPATDRLMDSLIRLTQRMLKAE